MLYVYGSPSVGIAKSSLTTRFRYPNIRRFSLSIFLRHHEIYICVTYVSLAHDNLA